MFTYIYYLRGIGVKNSLKYACVLMDINCYVNLLLLIRMRPLGTISVYSFHIYMHARYVALDEEFVGPRRACFRLIAYCVVLWRLLAWASVLDAIIMRDIAGCNTGRRRC